MWFVRTERKKAKLIILLVSSHDIDLVISQPKEGGHLIIEWPMIKEAFIWIPQMVFIVECN